MMRALIAVLALCPGYTLQPNGGHSNKPGALKSHLEQTVLSEPPAPASASNAATKGTSTAAPSVVPQSRVTPTKADVAAENNGAAADDDAGASAPTPPPLPKDAKNNVLKWAKNKPCAFTPAALEPTEQRSYKDETDYPELALKYWADPRIHGWGNVGSSGAVHAFLAPTRGAASFTPSTRRSLLLTQVHGGPRRLRVRRPRHARRRVEINFLATHAIEATFSTQAQRGLGRRRRGAEHRRRAARDELRRPRHGHGRHG